MSLAKWKHFPHSPVSRSPARKYSAKHLHKARILDPGLFQISGQLITEIGSSGLGHKGFYDHWSKIEEKQEKCTVGAASFHGKKRSQNFSNHAGNLKPGIFLRKFSGCLLLAIYFLAKTKI